MAIAFQPNNTGRVLELTNQLVTIPNQWGLLNSMGLFNEQGVTQDTVAVSRLTEVDGLPVDRNWDERNSTIPPPPPPPIVLGQNIVVPICYLLLIVNSVASSVECP